VRKSVLATCAMICLAMAGCQNKVKAAASILAEELNLRNSLPPTSEAIAAGNEFYNQNGRAVCHGVNADGTGVSTAAMGAGSIIRNWRDPAAVRKFSDGYLFHVIKKGKERMPRYDMYASPEQSWQMVLFIRSVAGKPAPK
jgi:mono/diheme cytochrome c family protein